MIECTDGLGRSLKGSLDRPGLVTREGVRCAGGGVIEWDDGDLMEGRGGHWGERPGRGNGMSAAKLTGGVREG
jgi:hypothetical protein